MSVQSIRQYWFSKQKFRQVSYLYINHLVNIRFLRKTFQKYQISTQIIRNVIDLSHSIEKPFRLGPRHSKTIWCQWQIFIKNIECLRKTFENYRICTQHIQKVFDFDPNIWKVSNIHSNFWKVFQKYLIFMQNFRKDSGLYANHLKRIGFRSKTFERYRLSSQNV